VEVVASLSQGRTAAAQCGLFTYKSVPVIFEPPCMLCLCAATTATRPITQTAQEHKENTKIQATNEITY